MKNKKILKQKNLTKTNKKGGEKLPYKTVRKWIRGYYYYNSKGKRVHVRGHYKYVQIWVPRKW